MVEIAQGFEHCRIATNFRDAGVQAGLAGRLEIHKLVDQHLRHGGAIDFVKRVLALLPALNFLSMGGPKIGGQGHRARIQQITVFQCFVVLVIVGGKAQRAGLDAHIDVLRH